MHTDSPARDAAREILDADALARTLARLAHELIERADDLSELALVGIHTRGVPLARRLCSLVAERSDVEPVVGAAGVVAVPSPVAHGAERHRERDGRDGRVEEQRASPERGHGADGSGRFRRASRPRG